MLEHVGLKHLRAYFAKVRDLLTGDGIALIHSITSTDPDSGSVAWGGGGFINRYVFPHGELPHIGLALKEMSAAGLEAFDVKSLRRHYALTLGHWARRYEQAAKIRAMIDERRYRIWRVYLAGCAYAFEHGWMSVYQILAARADHPETDRLPLTRDFIHVWRNRLKPLDADIVLEP
jgi:cyclopropane-fatty-acyl-phospholipid synthase